MMKTATKTLQFATPVALCLALATACNNPNRQNDQDSGSGADSVAAEPALTQVWKTDSVFTGSESTLYDPQSNTIYVSCGNTDAGAKDGDGFIARLNPDGSTGELKWVTGLHAPKGMALLNGKLYVTDIDEVKIINVPEASVEKTIPVEGAKFLNDAATDGTVVYFSDSRTGFIYSLDEAGTVTPVVEDAEGINGLECAGGKLYSLDKEGLKVYEGAGFTPTLINSTVTGGDGLVILGDSTFVASRWGGEVFLVNGGEATLLLDTKAEKSNTADIGYIPDEQLVIVPTFMKNEVAAYQLEGVQ